MKNNETIITETNSEKGWRLYIDHLKNKEKFNDHDVNTMMGDGIEMLLSAMKMDYVRWSNACKKAEENRPRTELEIKYPEMNKRDPKIMEDMIKDYCEGLEVKEGRKYFKIISNKRGSSSVVGFVVKYGDKKFLEGDMLKPAGWAKPARNFARGNILNKIGNVRWTGIG